MAQSTASRSLRGRQFYEAIGSPNVVLAPMVDHSEFAWRLLSRSFMAPGTEHTLLAYTPMLHAKIFSEQPKYRKESFEPRRGKEEEEGDLYLDGNPTLDRPLFTQFCANDPDALLKAATFVAPYCDAVDLNLGCPQGIAKRGNYGAFLQEQRPLVFRLINKLHEELGVPVTAKIRIQKTREDTLEYAKMVLAAGASVLAVHGRQRHQKGQETGLADWSAIRHLRDNLPPETVIFANGNILQHDDLWNCLDATGADAVMSAEGNLYDPSIFGPAPSDGDERSEYWRGPDGKGGWRMDAVLRRYLDIIYTHVLEHEPPKRRPLFTARSGEMPATEVPAVTRAPKNMRRSPNLCFMKGHLYKLLRPLITKHTGIRDAVNAADSGDMAAFEGILLQVERVTAEAMVEYERGNVGVARHAKEPGTADEKRIWRPWWVCQTYVRGLPEAQAQEKREKQEQSKATIAKGFDPLDAGLGLGPEDIPVAG